jgi:Spy/CpxP family protein refolding chaperone
MASIRKLFVGLVLMAVALAGVNPAGAQGFRWWQNERFQKGLALTPEQIARLEEVFQSSLPALRAQKRALDKLEDELSELIAEAKVAEPEFEQFAARVEAARAELGKTRTLQLFRMRQVLTAEQHLKLKALYEEWERERHRGRDRK